VIAIPKRSGTPMAGAGMIMAMGLRFVRQLRLIGIRRLRSRSIRSVAIGIAWTRLLEVTENPWFRLLLRATIKQARSRVKTRSIPVNVR
jgi:hypothetical protein